MFDFLTQSFSSVFTKIVGNNRLTEKNIKNVYEQVKDALTQADVPFNVTQQFMKELQEKVIGQKVLGSLKPQEQFLKIVHEAFTEFLGGISNDVDYQFLVPSRILMMGLQGSGKTTTIAKIVRYIAKYQDSALRIMVASVDFSRPAAISQLEILVQQQGAYYYRSKSTNVLEAVSEIVQEAKMQNTEILILDTAGRTHINDVLLQELKNIEGILQPTNRLLVLDAMTGQESLAVAQSFEKIVGVDGALLTKIDSDTRGGAAFALRYVLAKPILFVTTGEKAEDFEKFRPERIAERMLGMGDLLTLAEQAQEKIAKSEQEKLEAAMKTGNITLEDFLMQLSMMNRMGSLVNITRLIPGMNAPHIKKDQIIQAEQEMNKFKAIIQSMTPKERRRPEILEYSRKKRIAKGAGVHQNDIALLLTRFEQLRQFVKLFKGFGRFSGL